MGAAFGLLLLVAQILEVAAAATLDRIATQLSGPTGEGRWFTRVEALSAGIPAPLRRLLEESVRPG